MKEFLNITIVSSSTREGRISHRIALALEKELQSMNCNPQILDLDAENLPPFTERYGHTEDPTGKLKSISDRLQNSDGFIFLTPEYNGGISSGLKSFIDVFAKNPFIGKPIGVATGSSGKQGGIRAAYQLQQGILSIFAYPIPQMLLVGEMDKKLDENGNFLEESFQTQLIKYLQEYLNFARKIS